MALPPPTGALPDAARLQFPYMFWAHTESFRSPYCLAQSGMPPPPADVLPGLTAEEILCFPAMEALPALEQRIAELLGIEPERVLVTPGASAAMHICAQAWFRPGNRVAVELPSYEPLRALPEFLGATTRLIQRDEYHGWRFPVERVEEAFRHGDGPGHAFLTTPHNPTGAVMDETDTSNLGALTQAAGGVLVSVECYMEYAPPGERRHACVSVPNAVSIGSLTKAYGLGALRIGWIALGADLAEQRTQLQDKAYLTYVDPPSASLVAARHALERLPRLLEPLRQVEQESRPHLVRWLEETAGVRAFVPPYGIISFPRIEGVRDTVALQRFLADSYGVDVVAGEYFGAPGHLRVACGVPEATLVEGLVRLGDGIRAWYERA